GLGGFRRRSCLSIHDKLLAFGLELAASLFEPQELPLQAGKIGFWFYGPHFRRCRSNDPQGRERRRRPVLRHGNVWTPRHRQVAATQDIDGLGPQERNRRSVSLLLGPDGRATEEQQ